jgi:hypothetical protein
MGDGTLPDGLNLFCQCKRDNTGTTLTLIVPKSVLPAEFFSWCEDNIPLGFYPADVAVATDEQAEKMGY